MMITRVGKQRGNGKCTVKEEVEGERCVGKGARLGMHEGKGQLSGAADRGERTQGKWPRSAWGERGRIYSLSGQPALSNSNSLWESYLELQVVC